MILREKLLEEFVLIIYIVLIVHSLSIDFATAFLTNHQIIFFFHELIFSLAAGSKSTTLRDKTRYYMYQ